MKIIGVTGGIGAGKSSILEILKRNYGAYIIMADDVGHRLMERDGATYNRIIDVFGGCVDNLVRDDGEIDRKILAEYIFNNKKAKDRLNAIVHPLVHQTILDEIKMAKNSNEYKFVVVEAAILKEGGLDKVCDEIWYVYAPCDVRVKRLIDSRGYSKDKALSIIKNQASDVQYRAMADVVIDNSGSLDDIISQIESAL